MRNLTELKLDLLKLKAQLLFAKGNWGHSGRPGMRGGSGEGGVSAPDFESNRMRVHPTDLHGKELSTSLDIMYKDRAKLTDEHWEKNLTENESDGIAVYSTTGHKGINLVLRHGQGRSMTELETEMEKGVSSALSKASLPTNVVVYRKYGEFYESNLMKFTDGDIVIDKGYTSTTVSKGLMDSNKVYGEIYVKKGSKAAYLYNTSRASEEHEVLINKGSKFKIIEKLPHPRLGDKGTVVRMELINE